MSADLRALLAGDPAEAAPWIESAARYGLAEAQLRLGQMLLDGLGVAKDNSAALTWFMRAAHRGAAEAMNMVGRCHENGWGTPVDLAVAAHLVPIAPPTPAMTGASTTMPTCCSTAAAWPRPARGRGLVPARGRAGPRPGDEPARPLPRGRLGSAARSSPQACDWYRRSAERRLFPRPVQLRDLTGRARAPRRGAGLVRDRLAAPPRRTVCGRWSKF